MKPWVWISARVALAIHDRQLAQHGGLEGVRDPNSVESALARPQNLLAYGDPDASDLAAAYAYGIARNHAFTDGNKRTGLVIALLFLQMNGFEVAYEPFEEIRVMKQIAAGEIPEKELAAWFRARLKPFVP